MIILLNELVNKDGTRIGANNVKLNRDDVKSSSNSTLDPIFDPDSEDGETVRNSTVQSTRQQGYRGYYSLVPMPAVKTPIISYMDDEEEVTKKSKKSLSKKKMKEMVEDIVTNKKFPKDVLDKFKEKNDLDKNNILDIEVISEENPLLVRKVKNLIDIIEKNLATGEQKGIILNFLISNMNTSDIPVEYKNEITKNLK